MNQNNETNSLESELNNDIDEQAVAWFIRLRADNVTSDEKASFLRWLNQANMHRDAFNEISKLWGDTDLLKALDDAAQKHHIAPQKKTTYTYVKLPLAIAACLFLAFLFRNDFAVLMESDYSTRVGERKTVYFGDGSTAMLNTDSSIAVSMDGPQRRVDLLKGEVYFEVKPDPNRPFIVQADHSTTRVLGTRFFVHEKSDSDEVKVVSGRVEVTDLRTLSQSVILHDRESVSVDVSGLGETLLLDSALKTSWVNGFLVFENATLESVIGQIRRYRTGVVVYKDNALREFKINGRINLRESDDMLKVLGKNLSVKMTYLTKWLVIVG
ncbi:FecR domain-containing protein [Methylobacter sp. S3L5C]|uniref:FecR family protein n=1 Tax=Methylobacter sp. S3L5C TaxID=2839024 RepID=UPI001FABD604|nr:FecR domain-containing protein [Methylobacter sp. S3L5C]UOA09636.1 FecR domain-containing protein [Methylobacter sp. S3L5C]